MTCSVHGTRGDKAYPERRLERQKLVPQEHADAYAKGEEREFE